METAVLILRHLQPALRASSGTAAQHSVSVEETPATVIRAAKRPTALAGQVAMRREQQNQPGIHLWNFSLLVRKQELV